MSKIARWLVCFAAALALDAAVKLPAIVSDHMVLQQGAPVRIWGTADAGESVRVQFQGQTVAAKAAENGKWTAWLKPLAAAGPLEMTIAASNTISIKDVLVGEVWVGSGQSNMEFTLAAAINHDEEIARADFPLIHLFHVKKAVADQPADDVVGAWQVCSPETVRTFSAVEYFFGRELYHDLHVPMGLIESDWGGTPAQSWTSRPVLEADPALKFILDGWARLVSNYPAAKERYDKQMETWNQAVAAAKTEGKTPPNRPGAPAGPGHPNTPAGLYNGMIAPVTPYAVRGVIWYQGESNANEEHAYRYRHLFRTMIEDWRARWGQADMPFLFVQLANFKANPFWPVLRESQTEALSLRNTGMALAIDIGDSGDVHPKNKQDVGHRLALAARHVVYHEAVEYSGPMYRQATTEAGRVRVWFSHADGLQAKGGGPIAGFTLAGADGNFVPADARLDGSTVMVSSPQVANPAAVRYAWADDPVCNLINQAGLPANPFRSDEPHYQ
jgi:sialate O-acetylesterase